MVDNSQVILPFLEVLFPFFLVKNGGISARFTHEPDRRKAAKLLPRQGPVLDFGHHNEFMAKQRGNVGKAIIGRFSLGNFVFLLVSDGMDFISSVFSNHKLGIQ